MSQGEIAELSQEFVTVALLIMLVATILLSVDLAGRITASRQRRRTTEGVAPAVSVGAGAPASSPGRSAEPDDLGSWSNESGRDTRDDRPGTSRSYSAGIASTVLATALLAVGVVARAIGVGRAPWGNMYEFSITGALIALVVLLVVVRTTTGRMLAVWVTGLVSVLLIAAVTVLYVPPGELVPALRHYWMILHVGVTVIAFGLFTVAAIVSALQIVAERRARSRTPVAASAAPDETGVEGAGSDTVLPSPERLDRLAYRIIAVGFPLWTLGPIIMGAIWAEVSWGRYWGWDPKEVWAFISWVVYAAYLHARATAGWKGRRASIIALIGFVTVLFSYFGVNLFFGGLHAYDGL
ncbi:MAG TPA: c-type cytochrome biogenesis protein CcsB [Jiangellaceae bacterium]|nr:c-type cytochrome biogenesis protein CcsB [Jiangellaceae bacterium]